jgi:hypothetical protein
MKSNTESIPNSNLYLIDTNEHNLAEFNINNATRLENKFILSSYELWAPFQEELINQSIAKISHFARVMLEFSDPKDESTAVDAFFGNLIGLEITLRVNWMPLWHIQLTSNDLNELNDHSSVGFPDRYYDRISTEISNDEQEVVSRYEHLFEPEIPKSEGTKVTPADVAGGAAAGH